ncbi:transposon Ty3-I Gag-Pol polyprotein [Trichonephila clavipes]|nr:transposon Ty3-I Gag-Pol polyprotein [Trichonephila clavipes]
MVSETTCYKNVSLDVNNKCFGVNFKLDTGTEVNILPLYILSTFKVNPKLSKTNISLTTYGNFNLKRNSSLIINCSTDKLKNVPLPFYVVNVKSKPILGLRGCKELKLIERIDAIECSISKNELIKQFKDVFTGVGEFPNEPYHITLKGNAVPVIHPPRRVPLTLQPKLKCTLDRLEKEGTVSKVNKPTDWVQSLVIVEKRNGNLRLCLDPRDLNKSDHKPLMAIVKKPMHKISSKMQRMILKLLKYDFELHWCAKIKDEVEKLAYQLNEEAERTERPIRRLSKVMYGSTCRYAGRRNGECLSSIKHVVGVRSVFLVKEISRRIAVKITPSCCLSEKWRIINLLTISGCFYPRSNHWEVGGRPQCDRMWLQS